MSAPLLLPVAAHVTSFSNRDGVCFFNVEVTAKPVEEEINGVTIHFAAVRLTKWTVARRFTHFHQFHEKLVASNMTLPATISKPVKQPKAFVAHDDAFQAERKAWFEQYLQLLLADKTIASSSIFIDLLSNGKTNVVEIEPPIVEEKKENDPPVEEEEVLLAQTVPPDWIVQIGHFEMVIVHKNSHLGVELVKGAVGGWFRFEDAEQFVCYKDGATRAQNWDTKFTEPSSLKASNLVPGGFANYRITATGDGFEIRSKGEPYLASLTSNSLTFYPDSKKTDEFKTLATSRIRIVAHQVLADMAVPALQGVVAQAVEQALGQAEQVAEQQDSNDRLAELHKMSASSAAESVHDAEVVKQYEPLIARLDLISANTRQLQELCEEEYLCAEEQKDLLAALTQVLAESQKAGEEIEAALEHTHEHKSSPAGQDEGEWAPRDRVQAALFRVFRIRLERETREFDKALQALMDHVHDQIQEAQEDPLLPADLEVLYEDLGFKAVKSPFKSKEQQAEPLEIDQHIENLVLRQARHFTEEMEGVLSMKVNKQWRERYCTLTADVRRRTEQRYCLRFFENKRQSKDPRNALGHVTLGLSSSVVGLPQPTKAFDKQWSFELVENPSRDTEKFVFHADSERTFNRWLEVLNAVTNSNWQAAAEIPCRAQHWTIADE